MKKELKNKSLLGISALILFSVIFIFNTVFVSASNVCSLDISLINQDPYPAVPNDYVNVVFQVSGAGNCNGVNFELIPTYPFSLEKNETLKTLNAITGGSGYKKDWIIPYKFRVDKDALDGENEIKIHYSSGTWDPDSYLIKGFNITVQDSRTNFDAVIQETTSSEVSIAIANTGKYAANSVVVKIPEQESFRATGTDGQMVGNLDNGDYTIVSFSLAPQSASSRNASRTTTQQNFQQLSSNLKFDIYYTDALGVRRIVNMELPLSMGNSSSSFAGGFARTNNSSSTSSWSNWYILIIAFVIIILAFVLYKRYQGHIKKYFNKEEKKIKKTVSDNSPDRIPDWIKNIKNREKKK